MKTCFIIMPFDPRYDPLLQRVLRPAAEAVGLRAERVDDIFRPGVILDDIKACIRCASVLMAVLTDRNANVFYELGLAHAEGKAVILISNTMDDVPSDLRAHRILTYNKEDPAWGTHLKKKIVGALEQMMAPAS
ncbi:MAG: hypothetical protein ABSH47_23055 [Bryobacteraceae bacterium]